MFTTTYLAQQPFQVSKSDSLNKSKTREEELRYKMSEFWTQIAGFQNLKQFMK